MNKLLVLNIVGLSPKHIGPSTPNLQKLAVKGSQSHIHPMLPALTCSVQTTYFTGETPAKHGIVGNGWFFRDQAEVRFWHQSNHLVQAKQIWNSLKTIDDTATTANIFCWYNMYCPADIAVTVRPMYPADGRKIPDIYTAPENLRAELNSKLGSFPLFHFWGPKSNIQSSQWICDCALHTLEKSTPTFAAVYLPHLDYALQKLGPDHAGINDELKAIDKQCGRLIRYAQKNNYQLIALSEYGIHPVNRVCHINRLFREKGWLRIREELGLELLDAGASKVFAVADHQLAHIYIQDESLRPQVRALLEAQHEVELILGEDEKIEQGLNHPRSGELIAVCKPDAWFSYYYWLEDNKAPDFARCVDIHRKPGYDPVELFLDPNIKYPFAKVAKKLIQKKLGFRTLMDVIPLDASLVRGSHGALSSPEDGAVFICSEAGALSPDEKENGLAATKVYGHLLRQLS